jgi:hypothetical protein
MQELQVLAKYKNGLVIHHWDTDGLCSAGLLKKFFDKNAPGLKLHLRTPTINNYFLTAYEWQVIKKADYDFIITVDINFPEGVVNELNALKPGRVLVFDHHKQEGIKSVFYYNKLYPSCSLVINEYLKEKPNLLAVLGAVGDKEERIKRDEKFWPMVKQVLEASKIDLQDALHMRSLLDSCYIANDYYSMKEAIEIIHHNPLQIMQDENLRNNLIKVNQALNEIGTLKPEETIGNILIYNIASSFNILSRLTRDLSKQNNKNIIICHQKQKEQSTAYVRRGDLPLDLSPLIKWGRSKGFNCGGKEEVVGLIYQHDFKAIKEDLVQEIKKIK